VLFRSELTRFYEEGRDLHAENAALMNGAALDAVTKEMRAAAKSTSFGALYGIGPRGLVENVFADHGIEITEAEAMRALDKFFLRFHVLAGWRQQRAQLCQARGYVRIGAGRLVFADWEPGRRLSFPQCCNLPVQGICADAMLRAVTLEHRRFTEAGVCGGLIASVHDELLAEVSETDAEAARDILRRAMIDAFVTTFPGAPTRGVAEARIGRTWAETKG